MIFLSSFFYRHSCNVIFNVSLMVSKSNNCLIVGVTLIASLMKESEKQQLKLQLHTMKSNSFVISSSSLIRQEKAFCGKLSYSVSCNGRKSSKITFKIELPFLFLFSQSFFSQ